jgi:hypothetical protein
VEPGRVITDYSGATSRLTAVKGLALPWRSWAFQPKYDGVFCQARTDRSGRIFAMHYRSGQPCSPADAADLMGLATGAPNAVLHGELEAQTEASQRARAARPARLHLFDVSRYDSRLVGPLPYSERYGLLQRWHAQVECYESERTYRDRTGRYHDNASGDFIRPVRRNLARLPIVPLHRGPSAAEQLWRSHVELEGGEGIVAVRLDAPIGKRAAKRKIKATDELDAVVIGSGPTVAELSWAGHTFLVNASGKWSGLAPGTVVSVRYDGFYERKVEPRFARIVRVRADL